MTDAEHDVLKAVLYAMREGCFMPLRKPKSNAGLRKWIQWGAMQNLHNAVAVYGRTQGVELKLDAVRRRDESREPSTRA